MTVAQLTGVVYSQSTVYSGTTAADYAGMNDGTADATGTGQAGTGADVPGWIMADCGAVMFIGHIVIGYDYLSTIPGGFGVGHLQTSKVQISSDGSTWTDLGYVPVYSSSGSTDGLVPVNIGRTARYVRIYKENPYIGLTEFQVWGGEFDPTDYSGCTVWLDADQLGLDDGDPIGSTWPDLSGAGHHGNVISSPAPVVKANAPNGKSVVRFKINEGRVRGSGMYPAETPNSSFTVIFVGRQWGPNIGRIFSNVLDPYNFLVGTHASGRNSCYDAGWINSGVAWTTPPTPWTTWGFVYTGSPNLGTFFVDGVESGVGAGGGAHDHRWALSGWHAVDEQETCDCEVAELICYDRALTTTERQQVENYLDAKWINPPVAVPVSVAFNSTGQLFAEIEEVPGTGPVSGGGGWTASPSPSLPVRQYGPGWSEVSVRNQPAPGGGWFALLEKVAPLTGNGALQAGVITPHISVQVPLEGAGALAVDLLLRNWRDVNWSGSGKADTLTFRTTSVNANFSGSGALSTPLNDGLSAVVTWQYPGYLFGGGALTASTVGGIIYPDGLSAIAVGRMLIPAYFASTGALVSTLIGLQSAVASLTGGGTLSLNVKQIYPLMVQMSGSGQVGADVAQGVLVLANLLGSGTLSATAFQQYLASLGVSGAGTLVALLMQIYQASPTPGGVGTVTATISQKYSLSSALSGSGSLSATVSQKYALSPALAGSGSLSATDAPVVPAALSGSGTLTATASIVFDPITETNTNRTNQPVPNGTAGCWVTLVGAGGKGGTGRGAAFANNGGGGGGGGGGVVARSWIPVADLGSTYSVVKGGAAQASSFSSGGKSVTANAGGVGANGGSSGAAAGGTGGTVSVTGFTGLTTYTGGAGGNGGTAGANAGTAGANQTTTTPGGGGGGGRSSGGGTAAGGKGGNSATAAGGTASGGNGAAATAPNPGGGGAGGVSTNGTGGTGGTAGVYGAGGGGGGGGNNTGSAGAGSEGATKVEWV